VFVTEASQLGFWSIGQVFSRYRNYEGEKERPLSERERRHLIGLMDEATVVVDKYVDRDPEQARWYAEICERFENTGVSVVATPWDHALANRVPLDLGAVAEATLDAKLAMAEVVLRGADRANRISHGLPEAQTVDTGNGQHPPAEPPRPLSEPLSPEVWPEDSDVRIIPAQPGPDGIGAERDIPAQPGPAGTGAQRDFPAGVEGPDEWPEDSDVRIIPAEPGPAGTGAERDFPAGVEGPDEWPEDSDVRIIPARPGPDGTGAEPGQNLDGTIADTAAKPPGND
jgi:hypothetical protein